MVNDNYHLGGPRVPLDPDDPDLQLRPNPRAGELRVGDAVRPNLRDRRVRAPFEHGKILRIEAGIARVRCPDRGEIDVQLSYLVKI